MWREALPKGLYEEQYENICKKSSYIWRNSSDHSIQDIKSTV